jgi:hypothetical protein
LSQPLLENVFLLLKYRKLIEVTWSRPVDQLVLWQPVHLDSSTSTEFDFHPTSHYLLVVGHKHQLLAVVLESNGFTTENVSGPEYGYVQRGFKLLRQVEGLRFADVCAASLGAGVVVNGLGDVDSVVKNNNRAGFLARKNAATAKNNKKKNEEGKRRRGLSESSGGGSRTRLVSAVSQPTLFAPGEDQRRSSMFRSHSQREPRINQTLLKS